MRIDLGMRPGATAGSSASASSAGKPQVSSPKNQFKALLDRPMADYYLILSSVILLVAIGTMMVLSSSSVWSAVHTGDSYYFLVRQVAFLVVSIPIAYFLHRQSAKAFQLIGWLAMIISIVLLVLVFTPLGVEQYGNRAWLDLGPLGTLQPSEFAKLALIVWSASIFANRQNSLDDTRKLLFPFLPGCGVILALVLAQHDLGTALIIGLIVLAMLWFVGAKMSVLLGLGLTAAVGVVAMIAVDPGRVNRIVSFFSKEPTGSDQPVNAIYALASGGWFGVGLGASRQKWGGLYNGAQTDYVFAVLGEELGLFGTISVLVLFLTLGFAGFRAAVRSTKPFFRYAAAGITAWITMQAVLNIAVVMRLLPVFGVPLPFLSQGGSALMANVMAIGVLLAAARNEPEAIEYRRWKDSHRPKITSVVDAR